MAKIKILLHSIWFPMAIAQYWRRALERRDDIELRTVGVGTGTWIPWEGGINVQQKYAFTPDYPLPSSFSSPVADPEYVKTLLGDWKPDITLTIDASSRWSSKPQRDAFGFIYTVGTDGHCLDYTDSRKYSDIFGNMHEQYAKAGDSILPYAYDPSCHYKEDVEKKYDVAMVGVKYTHRTELCRQLQAEGISVYYNNGEIFDEYRTATCQAHIGINWSSQDDLNARAFELPAMGVITVTNRTTDMGLPRHGYFDYAYQFEGANEADHEHKTGAVMGAVEKVKYILANLPQAQKQADKLHELIQPETYDNRVAQVLRECGFI